MKGNNAKNSLEYCKNLAYNHVCTTSRICVEDIEKTLQMMQEELLVYGQSPLLSAAFYVCRQKYQREKWVHSGDWIEPPKTKVNMSTMDGERWILFLGNAIAGNLERAELEWWLGFIFRNYEDKINLWNNIQNTMLYIKSWMIQTRKGLLASGSAQQQSTAPVRESGTAQNDARTIKAQDDPREILEKARRQSKEILDNAQKEADRLRKEAAQMKAEAIRLEAEARKQEAQTRRLEALAKQRASQATAEILQQRFSKDQEKALGSLDALRSAILEMNSQMRDVEKMIVESNTQKASRQLLDLYDIIADLRDSAAGQAPGDPTGECANTAHNMDMLLMLVVDALAEYGIANINTLPGKPFNGKIHEVSGGKSFDPKCAVIAQSVRDGFSWGEQVIRKEKIILQEEERD